VKKAFHIFLLSKTLHVPFNAISNLGLKNNEVGNLIYSLLRLQSFVFRHVMTCSLAHVYNEDN
jgi:hypothetical protein